MRSANGETKKAPGTKGESDGGKPNQDVGDALRRAYDDAVNEGVPDDLLDLLKKLD